MLPRFLENFLNRQFIHQLGKKRPDHALHAWILHFRDEIKELCCDSLQMVCCVELLVLPIPRIKDDEKEPVRKRADWMELVAQRRSTDDIIRVHGM